MWVRFFRLIYLEHILPYASRHGRVFPMGLNFLDPRTLNIFYLMSLAMAGFFLHMSSFANLHILGIFCRMPHIKVGFFLCMLSFFNLRASSIFYLVLSIIVDLFLHGLGFIDSYASSIFCLVPLIMISFFRGDLLWISVSLNLIENDTYLQYDKREIDLLYINLP